MSLQEEDALIEAMIRAIRRSRVIIRCKNIKRTKAPFGTLLKPIKPEQEQEQEPCQVCLDTTSNIFTTCNHQFCESCMKQWYAKCNDMNHFTCPMCRSQIETLYKEYVPVDVNSLD